MSVSLESVVRCVLDLLDRGPEERILVFSTWHDVLTLLEHAFLANGAPYARPAGGRKLGQVLSAFQGRQGAGGPSAKAGAPAPRVLLLAIKQGGNGLNLTAAQHVILVEPLLSSGLEAQAAGRVDRVGQTRETHVHRQEENGVWIFVMSDTVEENLHRLNAARSLAHPQAQARASGEPKHLGLREVALLLQDPKPLHRAELESVEDQVPADGLA